MKFKRFLCSMFGHQLISGVDWWHCKRCDYSVKRNKPNQEIISQIRDAKGRFVKRSRPEPPANRTVDF